MAVADESAGSAQAARAGLGLIAMALLPFGFGYFFSYLFRATNAIVAPDLVRDLGLSAGQLGLLTAAYLLTFALFQIPLGILLDRYGPRRVQAVLVAFGALGALLFAFAQNGTVLLIARAMIGIGFSGGLTASFKAVVLWVPEARRPLANAIVMSIGAIGLLVATTPLELAVQAIGWRHVFIWLALATLVVAAMIFLIVPERAITPSSLTLVGELREIASIARDPMFWAMAPLLSITPGTHIAIQTLWAGPWFRDVAGYDRISVANRLFMMAIAFFIGILASGAVADRLARRGVSLLHVILGFLAFYFASQLGIILDIRALEFLIWFVFGMTGSVSVLAFPWFASYFGAARSGRANAALNLPMFLLAFFVQYLVGVVLDFYPTETPGRYAPEGYQVAFALMLLAQGLALAWFGLFWRRIAVADRIVREAYLAQSRT